MLPFTKQKCGHCGKLSYGRNQLVDYCSEICRQAYNMMHIDKYTCDKIDKISTADYDFDHYNRIEGFSKHQSCMATIYLISTLDVVGSLMMQDEVKQAIDSLPQSISTKDDAGIGEILLLVHNISQLVCSKVLEDDGHWISTMLAWIGCMNKVKQRHWMAKVMEGSEAMAGDGIEGGFYDVAVMMTQVLMDMESGEGIGEKGEGGKQLVTAEQIAKVRKVFLEYKKEPLYVNLKETLGIDSFGSFSTINLLSRANIKESCIDLYTDSYTSFKIPLLTGHVEFDSMKFTRIKNLIIEQHLVKYNFVFVYSPNGSTPRVISDGERVSKYVGCNGIICIAKLISGQKKNPGFLLSSVGTDTSNYVSIQLKISNVTTNFSALASCPDTFVADEINALISQFEKKHSIILSKYTEKAGSSIQELILQKSPSTPNYFTFTTEPV